MRGLRWWALALWLALCLPAWADAPAQPGACAPQLLSVTAARVLEGAGATGYVLKERDDIEVSLSIRSVLRGGAPIDPFIARRILEMLPVPTPVTCAVEPENQHPALTEREQQILRLVADGLSNREIADQLFLSRYTVESHVKRIYRKLAVSSRTSAVRAARERGVIG